MYNTIPLIASALAWPTFVNAAALTPRFDSGAYLLDRASSLRPRALCSEGVDLICYGVNNGGTPQALDPDDVAYVASYLRFVGSQNSGKDARWTMPAEDAESCSEWGLPVPGSGTVLALAKHVDPTVTTSILYEDLANTIDGGEDGADAATALVECGANGGQKGAVYDAANDEYNTDEYKASGATPEGIVIKLVKNPDA